MHATLINPPYPKRAHHHPPFTPLGLGYLAAILKKNGYSVDIIDCQASRLTHQDAKNELSKRQPDVLGLTSTTLTYKSALKIVRTAKEVVPNCLTILGGCHATFWDEEALNECPQLDVIVRGEGENTLLELVQRLETNKKIHDIEGTTARKNGKIVKNPNRPYIENLDELPFPAHYLWPIKRLRKFGKVIFPLMTSRGCVAWCDFCTAVRMFGRKYRARKPEKVVEELEFLHNTYGADRFTFYDDTFTVNQSNVKKMCRDIKKRKMKIQWDCETRVDMVNRELLLEMKEAGCVAVWYGVESGSQKVIDCMGKGFPLTQVLKTFKLTKEAGLMAVSGVILGFPGETKASALETIELVERIDPDDVGYYIATPYPGTPMFDYVKKMGWLKTLDFDKYDTATPVFESPMLSTKDLVEIRDNAYRSFYLRPAYVLRMFSKGGVYGYSATRTALAYLKRDIKSKLKF